VEALGQDMLEEAAHELAAGEDGNSAAG